MSEVIPPLPQYAFMAWCSKHRDNFTLYLYIYILLLKQMTFNSGIIFDTKNSRTERQKVKAIILLKNWHCLAYNEGWYKRRELYLIYSFFFILVRLDIFNMSVPLVGCTKEDQRNVNTQWV
jgi:hypothetical protein